MRLAPVRPQAQGSGNRFLRTSGAIHAFALGVKVLFLEKAGVSVSKLAPGENKSRVAFNCFEQEVPFSLKVGPRDRRD